MPLRANGSYFTMAIQKNNAAANELWFYGYFSRAKRLEFFQFITIFQKFNYTI